MSEMASFCWRVVFLISSLMFWVMLWLEYCMVARTFSADCPGMDSSM